MHVSNWQAVADQDDYWKMSAMQQIVGKEPEPAEKLAEV